MDAPLLRVERLTKRFPIRAPISKRVIGEKTVLDNITFDLPRGETLGIVGESGSGKSLLLRVILGVVQPTEGRVIVEGREFRPRTEDRPLADKRAIQMIFQDPGAALHPRLTVYRTLAETFRVHGTRDGKTVEEEITELLELVGLSRRLGDRYPHQLSGGQRQRVVVARALAVRPQILLCDDPVAALDVSLAAQVLNLLLDLQEQLGLSYVFVTNNLAVLRQIAHRIAVMHDGRIVELSEKEAIYTNPRDEYTRELLEAAPSLQRSLAGN
ncbi:MAG TPA: ATP-binding cassette domain-containing protein [Thermomicrobiales bacterium]